MTDQAILANLISARAEDRGDLDTLTFVHVAEGGELTEERRSYRALAEQGQRLAAGLRAEGMNKGDRFALVMQNHPEFVDAMVASSLCGTVFVPIDPRIRGEKLAYMLDFAECRGAIVADYALDRVLAVLPQVPGLGWIWVLRTGTARECSHEGVTIRWLTDLPRGSGTPLPAAVTSPLEPMQMLFTSGTTGDPKAIVASYTRFDNVASIGPLLGLADRDRLYTGLSLTHANAQLITLGNALKMGLPCVVSRRFTKSRLWEICRRYGCTFFNLLGGMTTAIYSEPEKPDDGDNPVRMVLSAGMPAPIWENFARRFDLQIFEFYGAAEGGMTFNPPGVGPVGSIGKPPPTLEAKIFDDNDQECPPSSKAKSCSGMPTAAVSPWSISRIRMPRTARPVAASDPLDTHDLYRHCREHLESNFVPGYIQVMEEIPKTASEKPQERFCLEFFRDHPESVFTEQAG